MLFTATAPPSKQEELIKLMLLKDPVKIIMNPDRHNIFYNVICRPPSQDTQDHLDEILDRIGEDLLKDPDNYPITIIYTDTRVIAYAYRYLERKLGRKQYTGTVTPENRIFAQFHQEYTVKMKSHIVSEICKIDSKIRLVLATVALGMGLDAPEIRRVIHYKPPTSLEKYFQETGRAGRDNKQSEAILYYNATDIRSNRPGLTKEMARYCKTTVCLRETMLEYFGHKAPEYRIRNKCCCKCKEEITSAK